jgi:hypothetical protein
MKRRVILRNGQRAEIIESPVTILATGFGLQGRTDKGQLELWTADGHWREDKTPHPLDIIRGLYVALTPEEEKAA